MNDRWTRLITIVVLLALFYGIKTVIKVVKERKSYKKSLDELLHKNAELEINTTEDKAQGFGYKTRWIAIKTNEQQKVAEILGLKNVQETNWNTGLANVYNNAVFITPPIGDWILAVGEGIPAGDTDKSVKEIKLILKQLSAEFNDAQFFCTHRVVEFHCWMKAENGNVTRVYSYLGESGENLCIEGKPTDAEKDYNFINTFSEDAKQDDYFEREDLDYPDEEIVNEIAEKWSVNPTTLEDRSDIKGLGLVGE